MLTGNTPILVLKEGTKREKGRGALANNIAAMTRGLPPRPFKFKTLGLLATIGRRAGVAEILNMKFSGIIAWWLWRAIYLSLMPGLQKKVRVALDWTLDLFFSKDIVQLPTLHSPTISQADDARLPAAGTHGKPIQQSNGEPNLRRGENANA